MAWQEPLLSSEEVLVGISGLIRAMRRAQPLSGRVEKAGVSGITGAAGTPADAEDTLRFAELVGARAMIETYPLAKAAEAYARMMSGHAQFRVVLTM